MYIPVCLFIWYFWEFVKPCRIERVANLYKNIVILIALFGTSFLIMDPWKVGGKKRKMWRQMPFTYTGLLSRKTCSIMTYNLMGEPVGRWWLDQIQFLFVSGRRGGGGGETKYSFCLFLVGEGGGGLNSQKYHINKHTGIYMRSMTFVGQFYLARPNMYATFSNTYLLS